MAKHRIEYWRKKRDLTQVQLGELTGNSQNAIWRLETDKMELKSHHLPVFARALGVRPIDILPLEFLEEDMRSHKFSETEAQEYRPSVNCDNTGNNTLSLVEMAVGDNPNRNAWTLQSDVLEDQGYIKGDILITDMSQNAKAGDIVCAELYANGTSDTVFRIFQPPYLLSGSQKPLYRQPIMCDYARVKIIATVTQMIRLNPSAKL